MEGRIVQIEWTYLWQDCRDKMDIDTNGKFTRMARLYRQDGYTGGKIVYTRWIHGWQDCIDKMDTRMARLYRQDGYTGGKIV